MSQAGLRSTGGGGGLTTASLVTVFDSSGTWTKDFRTHVVEVIGWNGGSGGASGRKGASTLSSGGGGGAGGVGWYFKGPQNFFGATETVTIGATSNGGAAQTVNNTNGNPGSVANATSFGNIQGDSSTAASGGATDFGLGATALGSIYANYAALVAGSNGGSGSVQAGTHATELGQAVNSYLSGTGGGGGSGYDTGQAWSAGNGGDFLKFDDSTIITAGGTGGIESGTINGGNGNVPASSGGIMMGGTGGGGGGGPFLGTVSGNGGNGAIPGGGGGGGGGGINNIANSGAGGTGARGRVIVIEYF